VTVDDPNQVERELQRLAAIVKSSDDAIVSKTFEGIVTSWNAGAERMFGFTSDEVVGRPITIIFPPDRLGEEAEFLSRLARGEHIDHFETVRVRKDGERIHVSVSLSPIKDRDGAIVGVSKIARDITERVKLTMRERASREEAEAANRLKDEFLATLSHELRTPLNAVLGWARILQRGDLDPAMQKRALDVINRNCGAQLGLINDLLDMSRIMNGRLVMDVVMLRLSDVVDAAVEAARPTADDRGITLTVASEPETPPVLADPDRLQQVVANLLGNALKFTPRGGRVRVRLGHTGSKVILTVSDNGIGIAGDLLSHVFDRFRQGDGSMSRAHGGLGLGLAIVRHIVELHGGTVQASSEGPGQGATFSVAVPVAAVKVSPREARGTRTTASTSALDRNVAAEGRLKSARVVVIDDDRDSRELIATILRQAGAVVFTAGSANEALGTLAVERPDAVVSDLGMPIEDGFSLMRRIRALPDGDLARTPALALTAYARTIDQRLALTAGFNAYRAKPVDPVDLVDAVARLSLRASAP
jgi:PAS domain S-box-containing protein